MKKLLLIMAVIVVAFIANAQVPVLSEGFETSSLPAGWTLIDGDGDGQSWVHNSVSFMDGHNSSGAYLSFSQNNVSPDNWLVTPALSLGSSSTLKFWRMVSFLKPADHYGVYISTTSATDPTAFTLLFEETPVSGSYAWLEHTVDLSAYDNGTVYIAFRHFNCTNQFAIVLDDILVTTVMSAPVITVEPASMLFPDVPIGTTSDAQVVTVNAFNVTGTVAAAVTVNAPFEISIDGISYSTAVALSDTDHNLYVQYIPSVVGVDSAVVTLTAGSATAVVALYGNSIACAAPTGLSVSAVTSTSAVVNWTGSAESYNLYYKAASDTDWTVVGNLLAGTIGYTIDNLTPSTTYTWYVVSVCGDGSLISCDGTGTFTTGCAAFTVPFVQEFDGSTSLPQCWNRYNGWASEVFAGGTLTSTTGGWNFYDTHVFGANHARLNIYGTSCNRWLVTPDIDLSGLTNPALTFDLALAAWGTTTAVTLGGQPDDRFMVIVSTDGGITWSAADATVWSNDGNGDFVYDQIPATGQEFSISLADYTGQTVRIAFYGESTVENGDNDLHIDNVMVNAANSCAKPTNLSVIAVTGNSVTLDWVENGTATAWNIEYGPMGYQQGSGAGTLVQANTDPFTINNLAAGAYDFYLQSDCGDEQSLWQGPVSAAPGSYNMNPSGSDTLTTCSLVVYDNGGVTGDYAASCDNTLVLFPEVAGNAIALSGSYHTESCCDYLRVYDGAGSTGTMLGEYKGTGTIASLISSTGPLTLVFHSDFALQYEGFELFVSCVSCMPPGNLTVSNVGSGTADLSWSGTSTFYTVEYKAAGDTAWTTATIGDTALTLTGLDASTVYTVNVYGDCNGETSPAATATFSTTMVPAGIPFSTDFNSLSEWVLNNGTCSNYWTISPVSDTANALFVTNNGTTPGYNTSSFSAVSAEKLFTVGEAAELVISFDVQVGGETDFDYLKVFFAPADEEYPAINTNTTYTDESFMTYAVDFSDYLQYSTYDTLPYKFNLTDGNTVSVTVAMPNPNDTLSVNSTAKLVFLWKNDSSDGSQPGAIVRHVSVAPLVCPAPTNLVVSNVTTTSADLIWNAGGTEDDWILEYRENGDSVWTSMPVSGTPAYTLYNLNLGTVYQVRVQAVCNADEQSMWVSATFTADTTITIVNPTVTTIAATNIGQTTATLTAVIANPDNVTITAKGFEWKVANGGTYTQVAGISTGSSFTADLTGLTANTAYTFKAFITFDGGMVYGGEMSFTTDVDSTGIKSRLANSVTLYPNPANEYVEIRVDGNVNVTGMEVYDVHGKAIRTVEGGNNYSPLQPRISVSGLADGMYFVRVMTDKGVVTKPFVKK